MTRRIIFALLLFPLLCQAQDFIQNASDGGDFYKKEDYPNAIEAYKAAFNEKPEDYRISYNLGNAYYKAGQYDTAMMYYAMASKAEKLTPENKAKHFYNLGNALFQNQNYEASRDAFIESLKINPSDEDARHNLFMVQEMLRSPQKQQQHQQQLDQDKKEQEKKEQEKKEQEEQKQNAEDQKDQSDEQSGENKKGDQQDQQQDQQQGEDQSEQNSDDKQKDGSQNENPAEEKQNEDQSGQEDNSRQQGEDQEGRQGQQEAQDQGEPREISEEDADRIFQVIEADEKDTWDKVQKAKIRKSGSGTRAEKEW